LTPSRDEFWFAPSLNQSPFIPAKAGIQKPKTPPKNWAPLSRGRTELESDSKSDLAQVPPTSLPGRLRSSHLLNIKGSRPSGAPDDNLIVPRQHERQPSRTA
jgi:hypothetical protein